MGYEIKTVPGALFLADSKRLKLPQIPEYAGGITGKLEQKIKDLGLKSVGPCVFFYFGADGKPETEFELVVGVPVDAEKGDPAPYKFKKTEKFKCLATEYVGGMPGIGAAWGKLMAEAKNHDLKMTGEGREIYIKWVEFDSKENVTELQMSIE